MLIMPIIIFRIYMYFFVSTLALTSLYPFHRVLDEVWVLLDALEKRQASLEQENQELKKELEDAKALIKQGDIDKSPS